MRCSTYAREKCTELDPGVFVKDLSQLGRSLARTVLVDELLEDDYDKETLYKDLNINA